MTNLTQIVYEPISTDPVSLVLFGLGVIVGLLGVICALLARGVR